MVSTSASSRWHKSGSLEQDHGMLHRNKELWHTGCRGSSVMFKPTKSEQKHVMGFEPVQRSSSLCQRVDHRVCLCSYHVLSAASSGNLAPIPDLNKLAPAGGNQSRSAGFSCTVGRTCKLCCSRNTLERLCRLAWPIVQQRSTSCGMAFRTAQYMCRPRNQHQY